MLCMCNINIDFTSELQGIKNWEGPGNKGTLLEIKNEVIFFFFCHGEMGHFGASTLMANSHDAKTLILLLHYSILFDQSDHLNC